MRLLTFGYQLYEPKDLWAACDRNRVSAVIDVRRSAISEKSGWASSELESDPRYEHHACLGNMRGAPAGQWAPTSWATAEADLTALYERIMQGQTLLLLCAEPRCFEVDWQGHRTVLCHRYEIARRLREMTGCRVRHLL